jgi:outer membrane receptor protein involved in Fe transport
MNAPLFAVFVSTVLGASRLPVPTDSARVPGAVYSPGADLRQVPGIVMYDQVGNEFQPTVDLRGFNATPVPATVVLLDGVRMNEADFGQVNWQLIPLTGAERVEVLPGPQTLYGPGAMGGVINVTTPRGGKTPEASAGADVGSWGLQRQTLSVDGPMGPLTYRVDASHEAEDGWRRNSNAIMYKADSKISYEDARNSVDASYRFADDDLRQAGSLTAAEAAADPRQNVSFVNTDSSLHQGTVHARRSVTDETSVSVLADARRRLENTPLNQGRTSVSQARADMNGQSVTVQADDRRAFGARASALTAGAELSRDSSDSSSSGSFSGFGFANAAFDVQRRLGLFAQESFDLLPRVLVLTGGARWDRTGLQHEDKITESNSGTRVFNHFSPRVGLNWNPNGAVEAFASVADSFRAPTTDEITALGPFSSAPTLRPVRARSFELGSRARFGDWAEGSVSVYRTLVHDEIFAVYDPTAGFGQNINIDKTRRDGLELAFKPRWGDVLDGFVNYGYTEATFQTDFALDKAPFPATQQVHRGDYLPAVPRHRLSFGANAHPVTGASVGLDETCVSSQRLFGDESNTEPSLGGYCVLGGGASYEKGAVRVFVRGDNLLDRRYQTRGILGTNTVTSGLERYVTPAPGISFSTGVRIRVGG